ncbi:histone deacetylase 8-like, partial [Pollicipes pollicipes]|uniref:histone deacetylase 8-like n=1 Tax=Pollicipes pollicipes TaxID=41117 RepID=UPI0018851AF3
MQEHVGVTGEAGGAGKGFTSKVHCRRLVPGSRPGVPPSIRRRDVTVGPAAGSAVTPVLAAFRPDALVCQCGADGLAGDPLGTFSLTPASLDRCVARLLAAHRPILLLGGGGGYHPANAARCWAQLTALVLSRRLPDDIPEHQFFMNYGPSYDLAIIPGLRKDNNTAEYPDHPPESQ